MNKDQIRAIFENRRNMKLTGIGLAFSLYYGIMGFGLSAASIVLLIQENFNIWILLLGVIHLGLWIWTTSSWNDSRICAQMMLDAMDDGGKQLAWIYRVNQVTPRGYYQSTDFHFCFTNKKRDSISLNEADLDTMLKFFGNLSLQISIGFSKELEKRYARSPKDLKDQPERTNAVATIYVDPSELTNF